MQVNQRFVSKRLLLSLFFCAANVILLQNFSLSKSSSFTFNLVCLIIGLGVCVLMFLPSIILKTKYNCDIVNLRKNSNSNSFYYLFAFYAAYFVYTAEYFLLPYTQMFRQKYYSQANEAIIAFIILAVCFYAGCRGTNVITRFAIFVFVFALLTFILMFSGSASSLDFVHYSFELKGGAYELVNNSLFFATTSFIAVIFSCLSGYTQNFKPHQPIVTLGFVGVVFAAISFFVYFALGDYSQSQSYQTYLFSKVAKISGLGGVESFYSALTTLCVFIAVSLMLCCINRGLQSKKPVINTAVFAVLILVLHICATSINSVKEILTNQSIFLALTFVSAFVIPLFTLLYVRRHENA